MKRFVEYEKLSKKQKREIDKARRATWGDVSPVTKRIESAKIYNRKKHRRGGYDSGAGVFVLCCSQIGFYQTQLKDTLGCRPNLPEGFHPSDSLLRFAQV